MFALKFYKENQKNMYEMMNMVEVYDKVHLVSTFLLHLFWTPCLDSKGWRKTHLTRRNLLTETTEATEFGEITQTWGLMGYYPIQGHSRSPSIVPIKSSYANFLSVINTNLPPILHRFRDIAFDMSKIAIFG